MFRTFLGKTSARITAKEQEALVKSYTKLLQLLNDSATKNCTAFKEGFVKEASVLKKQIEEQQLKLIDSAKRIKRLEIRKTKNEVLKQIGQSGEDSCSESIGLTVSNTSESRWPRIPPCRVCIHAYSPRGYTRG